MAKRQLSLDVFFTKKGKSPPPSTSETEPDSSGVQNYVNNSDESYTDTLDSNSNALTEASAAFNKRDPCFGPDAALEYIEEGP